MSEQPPLRFDGRRDGVTFDWGFDLKRLNAQHRRVFDVMRDGRYRSLREISRMTGDPEASVSARLRDFRKERFGALVVERWRRQRGLWLYRLVPPEEF